MSRALDRIGDSPSPCTALIQTAPATARQVRTAAVAGVLGAISVSHLLNDTIQSLVPAIYPLLKESFALTFSQVGLLALTLQLTASLLQPVVGFFTDRRPRPYSLVAGMCSSLAGLLLLSRAWNLP